MEVTISEPASVWSHSAILLDLMCVSRINALDKSELWWAKPLFIDYGLGSHKEVIVIHPVAGFIKADPGRACRGHIHVVAVRVSNLCVIRVTEQLKQVTDRLELFVMLASSRLVFTDQIQNQQYVVEALLHKFVKVGA